jgi:cobaltochelatase CobN
MNPEKKTPPVPKQNPQRLTTLKPDILLRSSSGGASAPGRAWITFYRAWHQTGDLAVVDALAGALISCGLEVSAFYAYSLREPEAQEELLRRAEVDPPDVVLTLQSFSIGRLDERVSFLETLGCPVLQVVASSDSREAWQANPRGLTPSNVAMSVALPETDGRVLTTAVGFKETQATHPELEFQAKGVEPDTAQIQFVAELAANWVQLRKVSNAEKHIAIILANYPNRDSRLGNGVGLDTPASVVRFLHRMQTDGYDVGEIPEDGDALIRELQAGITNDEEQSYGKPIAQGISSEELGQVLSRLPDSAQERLRRQWSEDADSGTKPNTTVPVAGMRLGNVFIGIQPQRGFGLQTQAIYHDPELAPPPNYFAFYHWIRTEFKAHALIHFGKHGNLEWLPGRSVALGPEDFPQSVLGPLPHLYPFIVNDPGEGTQAKRRTSAVIVDHLTPPLTRAGLYDALDRVERLLEEHAHCETMYPERAHELEHEIEHLLEEAPWREELPEEDDWLNALSNYLCELKESQIRSGLHIFGEVPQHERRLDFLLSLLRMSSVERPGLLQALLGKQSDFDLDSLSITKRDHVEGLARDWVARELQITNYELRIGGAFPDNEAIQALREWLHETLIPRLDRCALEPQRLLGGLSGKFLAPGPAGAPTRGRIDVLPTGRNFYSIDPRVLPTQTSWKCGQRLADALLERYKADHGNWPKTLALVIWGTSNMRTGGDDLAQALWLWGCEPVWEPISGRVVDFEILPVSVLGRPRVDVVLRVSGMFRDAFGDAMRLLSTIPKRLAALDEPEDLNPIRAAWLRDQQRLVESGHTPEVAEQLAELRVFSSGPGCYGTGLLPLIDAGNWETKGDLTEVFLKWGGHAYRADGSSTEEIGLLRDRLSTVEIVHQNQDNREHDLLDSDDYFQFQGGLHAAVSELRGQAPITYHGDSANPEKVRIRTLKEEFNRVFRSRVLNPKWISGMREHGYKGAFEMAATVDYLFGYDATCDIVADYQYEEIAQTLLLDPEQQQFFRDHNPLALRDAAQRLLEAHERQLWEDANPETLDALESAIIEIQGELE